MNPDIEIITSNQFDLSALFQGGGLKQIKYYMDFVPLKLGVKINTDQQYYTDEYCAHFKNKAYNTMKDTMIESY